MNSIILFTKAPVMGKVKTRLQPHISKDMSLKIHIAFLQDMIAKINGFDKIKKYIYYNFEEGLRDIEKIVKDLNFDLCQQVGMNLGEKMQKAFSEVMKNKAKKVIILGTDSPTLPYEYIKEAFYILNEKDIVIGPAVDGGYYLIGMKNFVYNIFYDIEWGTGNVIKQTMALIKKQNIKTGLLPVWYDIDLIKDLDYLKNHIDFLLLSEKPIPENTYKLLTQYR